MSENLTQEQINILLTDLFVNMNNLDKTYYDMFYNPTPMDIVIERYDDNNVLQTYTIPNRAKDRQGNNVVIKGAVPPEGQVPAEAGTLYLDIVSLNLYYKASGGATDALGWIGIATGGGTASVPMGGTGRTSFGNTLIKGNGINQLLDATEFLNVPTSTQTDIASGNWTADYVNPYSADGIANAKVSVHNNSSTAHQDLFNSKQNKLPAMGSVTRPIYISSNGVVSVCNNYPTQGVGFPDYANPRTLASGTKTSLNTKVTAPSDGYFYVSLSVGANVVGELAQMHTTGFYIEGNSNPVWILGTAFSYNSGSSLIPVKSGTQGYFANVSRTGQANWSVIFYPTL